MRFIIVFMCFLAAACLLAFVELPQTANPPRPTTQSTLFQQTIPEGEYLEQNDQDVLIRYEIEIDLDGHPYYPPGHAQHRAGAQKWTPAAGTKRPALLQQYRDRLSELPRRVIERTHRHDLPRANSRNETFKPSPQQLLREQAQRQARQQPVKAVQQSVKPVTAPAPPKGKSK